MKLKVRIQRHLALAYLAEDSGDWSFVLCKEGLEKLLGRRLKAGEQLTMEVEGKEVES